MAARSINDSPLNKGGKQRRYMDDDDIPVACPVEHAIQKRDNGYLEAILEQAEIQWQEEDAQLKTDIRLAFISATQAGMNVPLWKAARHMLGGMIDETENGDAIREDFEGDVVAQGILLKAFEPVRLAYRIADGVLKLAGEDSA